MANKIDYPILTQKEIEDKIRNFYLGKTISWVEGGPRAMMLFLRLIKNKSIDEEKCIEGVPYWKPLALPLTGKHDGRWVFDERAIDEIINEYRNRDDIERIINVFCK
jgi:hypothetical protein